MKVQIVYNVNNEPRLLLRVETTEEQEMFKDGPDLKAAVMGYGPEGDVEDVSYILESPNEEDRGFGP